jgi:uncharacterized repeat protein (TIGR02543 family)
MLGEKYFYKITSIDIYGKESALSSDYASAVVPGGTYTVSYMANGGQGTVPKDQSGDAGETIYVANGKGLSRSKYTFTGWNTNSSGTGTAYAVGDSLTLTRDLTLYAQWKKSSITPTDVSLVSAGTFMMGSPSDEPGRFSNETQHEVTISKAFYMGKYEVTQAEWKAVMGTNPSTFQGDNLPVESVSWNDEIEYCNKLSLLEGRTPCYTGSGYNVQCNFSANGYRLPTEAEWEWAAKGGGKDASVYIYSGSNEPAAVAWYADNSNGSTHPIKTKKPNSLGLYDMSGNVGECCWDRYGEYPTSVQTDPLGAASGSYRVVRGGDWYNSATGVRSAFRFDCTPSLRYSNMGFRVCRSQ